MKYLILICDGMADLPSEKGTPLEYANTPNFDLLAKRGVNGLMDPIAPGVKPGSDTAHLSILGYDIKKEYCGRGPLEALGAGVDLEPGDVAFRANIATVDENFIIKDRRAGRITGNLSELVDAVNEIKLPCEFKFYHTVDHRGVLVLRGNLSSKVSDSDPHDIGVEVSKVKALSKSKKAEKTAKILNEFTKKTHEIMSDLKLNLGKELPANAIILRGAGTHREVQSFQDRYKLKGACIAEVALVKGVGKYLGMDLIEVKGSTGNEDTDIKAMFRAGVNALQDHDFVLINVKGTDLFGHDGDFEGKIGMIEKIDKEFPILVEGVGENVLALTADHATPVKVQDHSGDPVPLCIAGQGFEADNVDKFRETFCANGKLGRILGKDFMKRLNI